MHVKPAIGLWTHDNDPRRFLLRQLFEDEDIGWVTEFKHDHRGSAGGNGMNYWGVAYPDFTLDVKANKLFEPRRGRVERGLKDGRLLSPFTFQNGQKDACQYCAKFPTLMSLGKLLRTARPARSIVKARPQTGATTRWDLLQPPEWAGTEITQSPGLPSADESALPPRNLGRHRPAETC
jgi:hypothetical protein